jgi:hypothetical protein
MSIQWFTPNTALPTITIASYGIGFNAGALQFLGNIKSVALGCDVQSRRVYIKLLSDDSGFTMPEITDKTKNIRISCREFVHYLHAKCRIDISNPVKYYIDVKDNGEQLVVDLNAMVPSSRRKKNKQRDDNNV